MLIPIVFFYDCCSSERLVDTTIWRIERKTGQRFFDDWNELIVMQSGSHLFGIKIRNVVHFKDDRLQLRRSYGLLRFIYIDIVRERICS